MTLPRFLLLALLLAANFSTSAEIRIQPRIINGVESDPQAWSFMTALMNRTLGITVGDNSYPATYLIGSPARLFSGTLVDCGLASEPCAQARGNICLILRGNNTFAEKVSNCEQGGGIGAIIYNHSPGTFLGTLQRAVTSIPSVSVSGEVGQSLLAAVGEFASFGYTNEIPTESFCGATWLGQTWVVTAAHCVADVEPVAIMVNVGGHDLRTDQRNVIKVEEILVHTGYDADKIRNDIALLRLTHEPSGVTPVDMATAQQLDTAIAQHQLAKALGRGQQDPVAPEEPAPPTPVTYELYEVDMPLVTNEECAQALGRILNPLTMEPTDLVTDSMVCAGRPEGNIGTCFGDSGGPLLLLDNDTPYLAGITSWGIGCGEPGLYDVFTRVPSYRQEIEQTINVASTTRETGANGFGDSEADQKADHETTLERIFGGAVSILLLPTLLLAGLLRRRVK